MNANQLILLRRSASIILYVTVVWLAVFCGLLPIKIFSYEVFGLARSLTPIRPTASQGKNCHK